MTISFAPPAPSLRFDLPNGMSIAADVHGDPSHQPVLFLHGEVDKDVPVTQAEEMFVALRKLGVDAEMVLYPGMGHEFSSGAAAMDAFERTVAWFDKYLQQEESRPIP